MDEENVRDKLQKISDVMDNFSLETMKIAKVQADLCDIKKEITILKNESTVLKGENIILKSELGTLKNENTILKGELGTLKNENTILRGLNKTVLEKFSKLEKENTALTNSVDTLRDDVQMLKLKFMSEEEVRHQHSNEKESDVAGGTNEAEAAKEEKKSTGGKPENKPLNIERKPKTQRKREQNEIFRNWRKTMTQRKTAEDLWASGLLKVTIELWEDGNIYMDGEQILDVVRRNLDQLTMFMSSEESKNRFFLTIIKMCSMRNVSKQKFEEIMMCFVNQGPRRNRITELEVRKFMEIYNE